MTDKDQTQQKLFEISGNIDKISKDIDTLKTKMIKNTYNNGKVDLFYLTLGGTLLYQIVNQLHGIFDYIKEEADLQDK